MALTDLFVQKILKNFPMFLLLDNFDLQNLEKLLNFRVVVLIIQVFIDLVFS